MVATDKLFAGSIPEIYDRFLVPLIFEPYAADLARRVAALGPSDVLETAAGTGVLTRALAAPLAPATRIVATDLNQPMLDQAARRQPAGGVEWRQADALALPFADRSFDVVACQFGVMFFPDKVQGYREARRVLRPGGPLPVQRLGPHRRQRVRRCRDPGAGRALPRRSAALHGAHAARPSRRRAHPADLKAAGFADVAIEARRRPQQGALGPRCGGRLLPGHAAAQRDRGARRLAPGGGHSAGGRRPWHAASARVPSTAASARWSSALPVGEFVAVWEQLVSAKRLSHFYCEDLAGARCCSVSRRS